MMSDYTVEPINDGINEFNVEFNGPKESNFTTLLHSIGSITFSLISPSLVILFFVRLKVTYLFK